MKRGRRLAISFIFILLGVVLVFASLFSDVLNNSMTGNFANSGGICECNSCGDCQQAVDSNDCTEIKVMNDLIPAPTPSCIAGYKTANKTLDFMGHKIIYVKSPETLSERFNVLRFQNSENLKIKNGEIKDFGGINALSAVKIENSKNIEIDNFVITNTSSGTAIYFNKVNNSVINNANMTDNMYNLEMYYSNYNTFENLKCLSNSANIELCLRIYSSSENSINGFDSYKTGTKSIASGVLFYSGSSSNTLNNLKMNGSLNSNGINIEYACNGNTIKNSEIYEYKRGINILGENNNLENVISSFNSQYGVYILTQAVLDGVRAENNREDGIMGGGTGASTYISNTRACFNNKKGMISSYDVAFQGGFFVINNLTCGSISGYSARCNYTCEGTSFCANECVSGARECSGIEYKFCGNYDSDYCLEWGNATSCPSGQICYNQSCIAISNCTPGSIRTGFNCLKCNIQGTGYILDNSSCLSNQVCSNGICLNKDNPVTEESEEEVITENNSLPEVVETEEIVQTTQSMGWIAKLGIVLGIIFILAAIVLLVRMTNNKKRKK
ncbi:hypothetical protein HYW76_02985 [Candidatus Pacearchaeota archaeon]|nr:hypothetical protein [Candidatus Pacearchaeota archaeon]